MKTQFWISKWFVLIFASVLIGFGMQGTSYGQVCRVGSIIARGGSCTDPGSGEVFSVSQDGRGHFLFITAGTGINLRAGNVNFSANKRGDGSWKINAVTPGSTPARTPTPPTSEESRVKVLVVAPDSPPIYWTERRGPNKIQRANLDGSNVEDLVTRGLANPAGIALDVAGGKMYWIDNGPPNKIQRANLDGSNVEDLVTRGLDDPWSIALDVAGGKMYWTDLGTKKIQRANLDGSNVEDLVTRGLDDPWSIALDIAGGKMYWTDWGAEKIQRANLDGSNVEDLVTRGLDAPVGLALDIAGGKMYWTDLGTSKIQRANLDGSNVEDLVTRGLDTPAGLALDIASGKMYWTHNGWNSATRELTNGKIQRANLDGSDVEDLITGLHVSDGIALGIPSPKLPPKVLIAADQRPPMYWVDADVGTLHRLVDAKVENLLPSVQNATSLTVDVAGGKLYWTEKTGTRTGNIRAANLNGTNVALVKQLTSVPSNLTLDPAMGKLYLTNAWGKVQRLNVDGSRFEPNLITNLTDLKDMAVDVAGGKVYWIEQTGERRGNIRAANLDGTNVRVVKDLTSVPYSLAVDVSQGKLYLTNAWGKVQRMNIDGSRFEPNLITGLDAPEGVTVDAQGGKVYWTEQGSLRRADLNGETVEDVVTSLGKSASLVLGIPPVNNGGPAAPTAVRSVFGETALLANYPNPFNPETWIPYQLETSADVTLTIYAVDGQTVRQLELGHQAPGTYQTRSRAAYWDGRNEYGEPVASGLYFYTLTAGDFTATRKMLIRK